MSDATDQADETTADTNPCIPYDRRATEPIMRYFAYAHLPPALANVSMRFAELADYIICLPCSAERSVALRKLLESKDAAVRAAMG
jgi:hypothetical protein